MLVFKLHLQILEAESYTGIKTEKILVFLKYVNAWWVMGDSSR